LSPENLAIQRENEFDPENAGEKEGVISNMRADVEARYIVGRLESASISKK